MSVHRATSATVPAHLHPSNPCHPERSRSTPSPSHPPKPITLAVRAGPKGHGFSRAINPTRAKRAPLCRRPEWSRRRNDQPALLRAPQHHCPMKPATRRTATTSRHSNLPSIHAIPPKTMVAACRRRRKPQPRRAAVPGRDAFPGASGLSATRR